MFCRQVFVVYMLIYARTRFGRNRTNSLWVLAFCSAHFKWKNWFEKTVLIFTNDHFLILRELSGPISRVLRRSHIKMGNFYFRPKLETPIFFWQYLIIFNDFFFTLVISFGTLLKPKNLNLKKITDLKVYGNLYCCRLVAGHPYEDISLWYLGFMHHYNSPFSQFWNIFYYKCFLKCLVCHPLENRWNENLCSAWNHFSTVQHGLSPAQES